MNDWKSTKEKYVKDHLSKNIVQPQRRLNALAAIETVMKAKHPALLIDPQMFKILEEGVFFKKYEMAKGKPLSSDEKSVLHGLYKFSI